MNCEVVFNEHDCKIQALQWKNVVENGKVQGIVLSWCFPLGIRSCNFAKCCVSKLTSHNRLGHHAKQALNSLKEKLNFDNTSLPPCDVYHKAKRTCEYFPLSAHSSSKLGELIHVDVWRPYKMTTKEYYRFFLTNVDDFTKATLVYILKSKDDVYSCLTSFFLN